MLMSDEEKKKQQEESQKHLDALRAKLLAKRASSSRPETPAKMNTNTRPPISTPVQAQQQENVQQQDTQAPTDEYGLESLLAEGQAAAEAETARKNEQAAAGRQAAEQQMDTISARNTIEKRSMEPIPQRPATKPPRTVQQQNPTAPKTIEERLMEPVPPRPTTKPLRTTQHQNPADGKASMIETNNLSAHPPMNLSDPYYDDLPVWLEFTGYHDQAFRDSKLGTYKQRKKLEQEAARIAQELEKLRAAETTDLASLRASSAHPSAVPAMVPPPLPSTMPSSELRSITNGTKRPHSPEHLTSEKAIRHNGDAGFRIRGADESSVSRQNSSPIGRRLSFSERRRSLDERERDPSLERRQRNYRRDGAGPPGPPVHDSYTPTREPPRPFNRGDRDRERDLRSGYRNKHMSDGYLDGGPQYRGSSGLDLRKGGGLPPYPIIPRRLREA